MTKSTNVSHLQNEISYFWFGKIFFKSHVELKFSPDARGITQAKEHLQTSTIDDYAKDGGAEVV